MATKKQKRLAGQARRAAFEAEVKADGLEAQRLDRKRRLIEEERRQEEAHKIHMRRNRFHPACGNCNAIKARQAVDKVAKAATTDPEFFPRIQAARQAVEING